MTQIITQKMLNYLSIPIIMLLACNEKNNTIKNPEPSNTSTTDKVLLIGFDGIRSDVFELLLESGQLPNMKKLIDNGVYFSKATTSDLTGSWGGWCDVLRGVHRDKHEAGYWGQNVDPGSDIPEFVAFPDLFTRLEAHNSDLNTKSFITWEGLDKSLDKADERIFENYNNNGDEIVTAKAVANLKSGNPDVVFFYQADTDIGGHNNGFGPNAIATSLSQFPSAYINTIKQADINAGKVLTAIKSRTNFDNEKWLVLFTSDHGGTNGGHSQNRVAERNVPIIVSSLNFEISKPTNDASHIDIQPKNIDIVPTILNYLSISKTSDAWLALEGHDIFEIIDMKRDLSLDKNLIFNSDAEYDTGFDGQDETIRDGGSKAGERDWPAEGVYWDQTISAWDDWTETPSRHSMTVAFYGSGQDDTFLQKDQATNWNGGKNFFCAGIDGNSEMEQSINISSLSANSYEISGYLGGSKTSSDTATITVTFLNSSGSEISTTVVNGPSAYERDNTTTLILKSKNGSLPNGTHSVKIKLKINGKYGFADNLSFVLKN
ncbi:alkaline phosphatase family protein [Aureibaculum conchae]|uniref:alkaline phosphatase family protein n=1 Tax=Aureibaculum sp. 2308TA14-22 TaxID=3108392 RepID=UPI0033980A29